MACVIHDLEEREKAGEAREAGMSLIMLLKAARGHKGESGMDTSGIWTKREPVWLVFDHLSRTDRPEGQIEMSLRHK